MQTTTTLRDLFAAHALTGYLAAHADGETTLPTRTKVAEYAYKMADAMLLARQSEPAPVPVTASSEHNEGETD